MIEPMVNPLQIFAIPEVSKFLLIPENYKEIKS